MQLDCTMDIIPGQEANARAFLVVRKVDFSERRNTNGNFTFLFALNVDTDEDLARAVEILAFYQDRGTSTINELSDAITELLKSRPN